MAENKNLNGSTSFFETVVKTIVDTDNASKKIVSMAEKKYADVSDVVKRQLDDYKKQQYAEADAKIEEFRNELEMKSKNEQKGLSEENIKIIESFEDNVKNNKDNWENEIIEKIITV